MTLNYPSAGRSRRLPRPASLLILSAVLAVSTAAAAEGAGQTFDIPAGPLATALNRLAEAGGLQLVYDTGITEGLSSSGLHGNYTPEAALRQLLQQSGLSYRLAENGTVLIEKPSLQLNSNQTLETLPPVKVSASSEYDSTDPYNPDYNRRNSLSATKTDTPIMETSISIQVVPRAVMDDQKSTRVADALENVSGVRAQSSLGAGSGFIIRGFRTGNIYRNGLLSSEGNFGDFDSANLESIEVVKGPAQLYGRTEPGGLISINTKKPLNTPYYSLEQQFGSYDLYRTQWDATGPITADKKLLYRFTGSYQDSNSFRDFVSSDRVLINSSITWQPTDATDVNVNIEGTNKNASSDFGIPVIGNRPAAIPISRNLSDPNAPIGEQSSVKIGSEINHHFNENWAIHNRFLASLTNETETTVSPAPAFNAAGAMNEATGINAA